MLSEPDAIHSAGGEPFPVGRPDFKSGWGCLTVPGGFDSRSLPPSSFYQDMPVTITNPVLDAIRKRKHAGAMMLQGPGPDHAEMEALLEAAAAAPDHGKLVPFRFVVVPDAQRAAFVEASVAAFAAAVPDADAVGLKKARAKAEQPPAVVALIACFQPDHGKIGMPDQWLTVGCALQNLWLAAQSLGFSCGVSSGRLLETGVMRDVFRLADHEQLVSIVSVGTAKEQLAPRAKPALADVVSHFGG
jgi:nitroreductase